jgi:hypothetical protein
VILAGSGGVSWGCLGQVLGPVLVWVVKQGRFPFYEHRIRFRRRGTSALFLLCICMHIYVYTYRTYTCDCARNCQLYVVWVVCILHVDANNSGVGITKTPIASCNHTPDAAKRTTNDEFVQTHTKPTTTTKPAVSSSSSSSNSSSSSSRSSSSSDTKYD